MTNASDIPSTAFRERQIARQVDAARFAIRSSLWAEGDCLDIDETAIASTLVGLAHLCIEQGLDFNGLAESAGGKALDERQRAGAECSCLPTARPPTD